MAACTHAVGTADTTVSPNATGSFTPAVGDLLVAFVSASATVGTNHVLSNSAGLTFTLVANGTYLAGSSVYCYVADSLVTAASPMTCTYTHGGDDYTGTVIMVNRVSGMSKTGLAAIRQFKVQSGGTAGTTPAPVFDASCLTGNPSLGCVANASNPAGMTQPTGWTERSDLGFNSPTGGLQYVTRDSGFTGTTVTWGSTSATQFGAIVVELDASGAATKKGGFALMGMGR